MTTLARRRHDETAPEGSSREKDRSSRPSGCDVVTSCIRAVAERSFGIAHATNNSTGNGTLRSDTVELFIPFRSVEVSMIEPFRARTPPDATCCSFSVRLADMRMGARQAQTGTEDGAYGRPAHPGSANAVQVAGVRNGLPGRSGSNAYPPVPYRDRRTAGAFSEHVRSTAAELPLPWSSAHGWPGSVFE